MSGGVNRKAVGVIGLTSKHIMDAYEATTLLIA